MITGYSFKADKLINDLSAINWKEVSDNCDVNKSFPQFFYIFYKTINRVDNKHAPLRDVCVRKLEMP